MKKTLNSTMQNYRLLIVSSLVGIALSTTASAADTHCTSQETTEFSCSTGKKIISVCASKDLSTTKGYLQYRFGRQGVPEIQVPAAKNHPNPLVKSGTLSFPSGRGAYLKFLKGDYRYVVYIASSKGRGENSGVVVESNNKLIAKVGCISNVQSKIGPKLFEKGGIPADDTPFKLP